MKKKSSARDLLAMQAEESQLKNRIAENHLKIAKDCWTLGNVQSGIKAILATMKRGSK